ncbi:MAG: hypothetical protein M1383_02545 [Patescibacteria group bacterium]|nr:hypothetical protein [Patescibacteria group bacterium]
MLSNLFIFVNNYLDRFLVLSGLRKGQAYWGTVYDSVTKQPLDPVVVRLVNAHTGKVAETCITGITGRYGFLVWPGKFKILPRKSNYAFPSQKVSGNKDGVYENLYHGEFFEISEDSDVVPFNIPMDPVNFDWNQKAKEQVVKFSPFWEHLWRRLVSLLFWFVLILALVHIFFSPSNFVYAVLGFYVAIFFLAMVIPKPRRWGRVFLGSDKNPASEGLVELSFPLLPDTAIAKAEIMADGKFFLRADPGKYLLKISTSLSREDKELQKTFSIKVGQENVINRNLLLK